MSFCLSSTCISVVFPTLKRMALHKFLDRNESFSVLLLLLLLVFRLRAFDTISHKSLLYSIGPLNVSFFSSMTHFCSDKSDEFSKKNPVSLSCKLLTFTAFISFFFIQDIFSFGLILILLDFPLTLFFVTQEVGVKADNRLVTQASKTVHFGNQGKRIRDETDFFVLSLYLSLCLRSRVKVKAR